MGLIQKAVHLSIFRRSLALVCLGTIFSLVTTCATAQTSQVGTVSGQATDESKAAVPGAVVTLTDTSTNAHLETTSNNDGRYVFSSVPPGTYNISFVKQGFSTYEVNGQTVAISAVLTINAMLKVGSTATTVEVSASAGAELQTMNATVGGSLNGQSLLLLPNLGRDVTSMAVLQPATTTERSNRRKPTGRQYLHARWRQHYRRHGRERHQLPDQLFGLGRQPRRQSSFGRDPHAHREHRGDQGLRQQPDLRLQ